MESQENLATEIFSVMKKDNKFLSVALLFSVMTNVLLAAKVFAKK